MKRTLLQKISNVSFYILLIVSCYLASCSTFARWDDYATLLNFTRYALIFFSGFFHHISYKYNSLWILSAIILVLHGITAAIFSVVNEGMLIFEIIVFVILLIAHFLSRGKFDGEIKIHEFDVKREDGKYVKVSVKEKTEYGMAVVAARSPCRIFLYINKYRTHFPVAPCIFVFFCGYGGPCAGILRRQTKRRVDK